MKKLFTLLALAITLITAAQAPQGFNYQATVRNNSGQLLLNQTVLVNFNILQNSDTGTVVYSENQTATTDDLGHINLVVGQGTPTTGTFSTINWANGSYYLGIEINTGTGYVAMGTTQLLSVPYALYANTSGNTQNPKRTSIYLTGDITNSQAAAKIAAELGPVTENIYIINTTQLTTVDLSVMLDAVEINVQGNAVLANVNFNGLNTVYKEFYFHDNPMLMNLSVQSLTNCFRFGVDNVPTLNTSSLVYCNEFFVDNIANFIPPTNLEKCNYIAIRNMPNTITLSFPFLVSCDAISLSFNNQLTSISFPVLQRCNLFSVNNNALTSSIINSILHKFLTVFSTINKNMILQGQNPLAPPTGQGIIDKQTLINTGTMVTTD